MKMRSTLMLFSTLLTGAIVLILAGEAIAAQRVVIDSSAATLEPGQVLDSSTTITLKADTHVSVIDPDGKVTTVRGPFKGTLGASDKPRKDGSALIDSLARLLASPTGGVSAFGGTRAPDAPSPPDAWSIDVSKSGKRCVRAGQPPALHRKGPFAHASTTIKNLARNSRAKTDWPAGSNRAEWPAGLAVEDGGTYLMNTNSGALSTRLVLAILPPTLPSPAHQVAWLAENGCRRQARTLLKDLKP
jgi:hypothetical protein